jgi:hypothetical protein
VSGSERSLEDGRLMMGALGTEDGVPSPGRFDATGVAGDAVSLTIAVSTLMSGADKPSIIDLPRAPSTTATQHTA